MTKSKSSASHIVVPSIFVIHLVNGALNDIFLVLLYFVASRSQSLYLGG